jgi:hypothetical protein
MAARLSALRAGRPLAPGFFSKIPGAHFCQRLSRHCAIVRPEGLGKLEKSTSSGRDPATYRFGEVENKA